MINLPNPFDSAPVQAADTAAASSPAVPLRDAAAGQFTEPSAARGGQEAPAEATQNPVTAGLLTREDYIPELFSVFARRRCMPIISPPLRQQCRREFVPDMDALFDAILPPEPPPIFLRRPSQAFIRALFELAH